MEMEPRSKVVASKGRLGRYVDVAKTLYHRGRVARRIGASSEPEVQQILDALRRRGYYVIENFYDRQECAELVREMDRVFQEYEPFLVNDELQSDARAYAADRVSEPVRRLAEHPLITKVMHLYMGPQHQCWFTMSNRVRVVPGNLGSGGGWHRDTVHHRQFKAIFYPVDVGSRGGPFTFLPGSHQISFMVKTITRCGIRFGQYQFTEQEFDRIVRVTGATPVSITAPAGTLIFTDTSAIHRGMPIEEGVRYAITNYCFDPEMIEEHKRNGKFARYFLDQHAKAAGVKA